MAPNLRVPGLGRPPLALLVDRDADTRHMYAEFLQQAGYDTLQAEDGRDALAQALARHPDVVVTETRVPGLSGLDLCRLLHENRETAHIRVVFVTGDAFEHELTVARAAGADAVLIKPCLPGELAAVMADVLQHAVEPDRRVDRLQRKISAHRRTTDVRGDSPMVRATPDLVCPICGGPLRHITRVLDDGDAQRREQRDDFDCVHGCGTFRYRQRTGKLRRVS